MKSVGGQLHASPFLAGSSQPMLIQTLARVHAAACVWAGRPVACQCQRKTGCWALAQTSASETLCSPCKPVERQLSQIWSEVLGIPESQISMQDNFFVLGGNSLLAMQAVRRLSHDLGLDLALQDFYQTPSIRSIAHRFRSKAAPMVMREEGVL